MNTNILDLYKIKFETILVDGVKQIQVSSEIIPFLTGFFLKLYPEYLVDELIPEINKAINGQSFDQDGGGIYHYLKIDKTISYFYYDQNNIYSIPTNDLKEILLSYVEWITNNGLVDFI